MQLEQVYQHQADGAQFPLRTIPGRSVDARLCHQPSQAMPKQGWIQDPRTSETKRFHADEKNWRQDPRVFVDSGRPVPGEAPLLKTRVHLRRDTAELLWRELLRVGWRTCSPQWGTDVDV